MGGGELGEDYLISDYNVLILSDGNKKCKKKNNNEYFLLIQNA